MHSCLRALPGKKCGNWIILHTAHCVLSVWRLRWQEVMGLSTFMRFIGTYSAVRFRVYLESCVPFEFRESSYVALVLPHHVLLYMP
jgi:hypothetical protein